MYMKSAERISPIVCQRISAKPHDISLADQTLKMLRVLQK